MGADIDVDRGAVVGEHLNEAVIGRPPGLAENGRLAAEIGGHGGFILPLHVEVLNIDGRHQHLGPGMVQGVRDGLHDVWMP